MGSENVTVEFTDVELEELAKYLGKRTLRDIGKYKTDCAYLLRAIQKVIRANDDNN